MANVDHGMVNIENPIITENNRFLFSSIRCFNFISTTSLLLSIGALLLLKATKSSNNGGAKISNPLVSGFNPRIIPNNNALGIFDFFSYRNLLK